MWGAKWGLLCGAGYFPLGLAKYAMTQGPIDFGLLFLIRAFLLVVIVGGVAGFGVGFLRPLLSWGKWGAALIGVLVSMPFLTLAIWHGSDFDFQYPLSATTYIVTASLGFGGMVGLGLYLIVREN